MKNYERCKMKAVILDGYAENPGDLSWEKLGDICELTVYPRTSNDLIVERIGDADIVITNKTPIRKTTIDQCPNMKFISVLATGFDVIDWQYAKEKNIVVSNVPSYGTDTVSQYAVALLLEVCHHIGEHSNSVKSGEWSNSQDWCFWNHPLIELSGKTAGIIGLGRIGQATAKILKSLNMKIVASDPFADPSKFSDIEFMQVDELYRCSDVIILHCPATEDNRQMINEHAISLMKNSAILINNSRGALINEADLAAALNKGQLAAAALDVVSTEPINPNNPLLTANNCIITPHISWATKEARARIMTATIDNISAFIEGNPINVINK